MSALLSGILGDDLSWEPDSLTRPRPDPKARPGPTWPDPTIKKGAEPEGPTPVGTLDLVAVFKFSEIPATFIPFVNIAAAKKQIGPLFPQFGDHWSRRIPRCDELIGQSHKLA